MSKEISIFEKEKLSNDRSNSFSVLQCNVENSHQTLNNDFILKFENLKVHFVLVDLLYFQITNLWVAKLFILHLKELHEKDFLTSFAEMTSS
jgi:hypothetical protein